MEQNRDELAVAEAKQQAGDKVEKKASRRSQQALQEKAQCKEEEIPACNGKKCKRGRESCCSMCPCDHKRYCELGRQQVALKELLKKSKGTKLSHASQLAVVEAVQFADNVVGTTSTKRKTRMSIETIPMDDLTEMEVT